MPAREWEGLPADERLARLVALLAASEPRGFRFGKGKLKELTRSKIGWSNVERLLSAAVEEGLLLVDEKRKAYYLPAATAF